MKYLFTFIVFVHGLIHLLGFAKGFGIGEIKQLTLPVSKAMGAVWLLAAILLVIYGALHLLGQKHAWLWGLIGIVISQFLILYFWKDARFGTLGNVILLGAVLLALGQFSFDRMVRRETAEILASSNPATSEVLQAEDIAALPAPVQNWLIRSGAVGRPKVLAGKMQQRAWVRLKPEQQTWYPASALQYTTFAPPAFIWTVDVRMNRFLNFVGRDKYDRGKGEMRIKMNALFDVVRATGDKIDEGTLQRFLGETVFFPSAVTSPYLSWAPRDEFSAIATMRYQGITGSGTFYFNEQGDFVKFIALRYKDNAPGARRYEWVLTVDDYQVFEGVRVPAKMKASWVLEDGNWTWLRLEIADLEYNKVDE